MAQNQFDPNMLNNLLSQVDPNMLSNVLNNIDPNKLASMISNIQNQSNQSNNNNEIYTDHIIEDDFSANVSNKNTSQGFPPSGNGADIYSILSNFQNQMSSSNAQGMNQGQQPDISSLMSMFMNSDMPQNHGMNQMSPPPQMPFGPQQPVNNAPFPRNRGMQRPQQFPPGMMGGMPNILSMLGGGGGMGGMGNLMKMMGGMGNMGNMMGGMGNMMRGSNPMMQMLMRFMGRR